MVDTCVLVAVETFQVLLADVDHLEQEDIVRLRSASFFEVGRPQRVEVEGRTTRQVGIPIPGSTRSSLLSRLNLPPYFRQLTKPCFTNLPLKIENSFSKSLLSRTDSSFHRPGGTSPYQHENIKKFVIQIKGCHRRRPLLSQGHRVHYFPSVYQAPKSPYQASFTTFKAILLDHG